VTTVRARVPVPGGARRAHVRERRRESLWFWPAVAAVAAWVAGDIAARYLHSFTLHQGLFPTDLDDARTLLATIAAALLTFTGVVFSITLVALQMASTQYSPRLIRTFVRKPVTKLALSIFIATFVYSLTLLARLGTTARVHTVPQGAVGLAYLLVMASVIVFVVFVHATVRSMRVTYVIESVFRETLQAFESLFALADAYRDATEPELGLEQPTTNITFDRTDAALDGIDTYSLVGLAQRRACVLVLRAPVGTYLHRGELLATAFGGSPPETAEVLRALDCLAVRTLYQDPRYGLRQLVDIASKALSPAINDPTTAVQSLDRIHGLLRAIADRPDPTGCFVDGAGAVRLVVPVPGWDRIVELAFTEVCVYGAGAPQVSRKLFAVFEDLIACVAPERRPIIETQRAWLQEEVVRHHVVPLDRALSPDPMGLG